MPLEAWVTLHTALQKITRLFQEHQLESSYCFFQWPIFAMNGVLIAQIPASSTTPCWLGEAGLCRAQVNCLWDVHALSPLRAVLAGQLTRHVHTRTGSHVCTPYREVNRDLQPLLPFAFINKYIK